MGRVIQVPTAILLLIFFFIQAEPPFLSGAISKEIQSNKRINLAVVSRRGGGGHSGFGGGRGVGGGSRGSERGGRSGMIPVIVGGGGHNGGHRNAAVGNPSCCTALTLAIIFSFCYWIRF